MNSFKVPENSKALMHKSISVPKNIYKEGNAFLITKNEFLKVQQYKRTHPNLIKERSGLFDSLLLIEQSYYSQKNKTMKEKHSALVAAGWCMTAGKLDGYIASDTKYRYLKLDTVNIYLQKLLYRVDSLSRNSPSMRDAVIMSFSYAE